MNNISGLLALVIIEYQAPYIDPISVRAGDKVIIDDSRKTDVHGWVWCTNQFGKSGWVPESYLERHGDTGYMHCDYDAVELTIRVGERLVCQKEESGFIWVTNEAKQSGWVPSKHVDLSSIRNK